MSYSTDPQTPLHEALENVGWFLRKNVLGLIIVASFFAAIFFSFYVMGDYEPLVDKPSTEVIHYIELEAVSSEFDYWSDEHLGGGW